MNKTAPAVAAPSQRLAYPINEAFHLVGLTKTKGYQAVSKGELKTFLNGRRRFATQRALEAYVELKEREGSSEATAERQA